MNIKKEHRPPEMQQEMEKILKELDDCTKKSPTQQSTSECWLQRIPNRILLQSICRMR